MGFELKMRSMRSAPALLWVALAWVALGWTAAAQTDIAGLRSQFVSPPADARPMVRWWWFGPAVVKPELARELDQMHAAGIGGAEIAAEYPMALDDPAKGILNLRYGSPEYVDMLRFANEHARALGMRVDLTLGSGWPFGGPDIPIDLAAGKLRFVAVALPGIGCCDSEAGGWVTASLRRLWRRGRRGISMRRRRGGCQGMRFRRSLAGAEGSRAGG